MTNPFAAVSGWRILQEDFVEKIQEKEKETEVAHSAGMRQNIVIKLDKTPYEIIAARRYEALFAKEAGDQAYQAKDQGNGDYGRHFVGEVHPHSKRKTDIVNG